MFCAERGTDGSVSTQGALDAGGRTAATAEEHALSHRSGVGLGETKLQGFKLGFSPTSSRRHESGNMDFGMNAESKDAIDQ